MQPLLHALRLLSQLAELLFRRAVFPSRVQLPARDVLSLVQLLFPFKGNLPILFVSEQLLPALYGL